MVLKSILEELKTSNRPVAKALHKTSQSKTICIGFNKGMMLKDHKAHRPTVLVVIAGEIRYTEEENSQVLSRLDEFNIPVEVTHRVEALEDSLVLLLQG
ncbi:MAG: hypothetical protein ABJF04_11950 [Reichenbachiella sp.]|uniref:hypothetical protein n=1 Tax=Reichenbachiella sp. TaxID=2184521 RepID=UPI00326324D2